MGHLLVCGWLRVVTVFIKCRATAVIAGWDDEVKNMITELVARICHNDTACNK